MGDRLPPRVRAGIRDTGSILERWAMAAKSALIDKITRSLDVVRRNVEALPRVEARRSDPQHLAAFTPDELLADRISFRAEWRDLMDWLDWLHQVHTKGQMSADQTEQYRALLPRINEVLPVMERLQLALPSPRVLAAVEATVDYRPSAVAR